MDKIDKLKTLYDQSSNHSNYQILPKSLDSLIGGNLQVKSRHESERLAFIFQNIDVKDKTILDIGGNTGFFTFGCLENGAKQVDYFEGNRVHSDFVQLAAEILGVSSQINVINKYLSFENELDNKHYDVTLLLNVLHHLGDDYGDKNLSVEMARINILKQLNSLADKTSFLIFQLGFNWKGNRNHCLFENGTKKDLIDFVLGGIKSFWDVLKIGIAEIESNTISYNLLCDKNIERFDSFGEFLNRPVFVLKSKK